MMRWSSVSRRTDHSCKFSFVIACWQQTVLFCFLLFISCSSPANQRDNYRHYTEFLEKQFLTPLTPRLYGGIFRSNDVFQKRLLMPFVTFS